ncbi:MAG: efflux RND transporter periplasmic adaptor subunit [Candidatus Solibacter sp.]|nr:efflux RND transporter periplasmic adaptor subunit [Candidatus Solibacter sp.]
MDADLKHLKINRDAATAGGSPGAVRWILMALIVILLTGAGWYGYGRLNAAIEVETARAAAVSGASGESVALNATGYVVAAHKIQVASKVVGRVAWIGVDKGDLVREGQVIVRLEDEEYRAQLEQARGQLASLQARLAEAENGSRPEEIAVAQANVDQARAELENARVSVERTRGLHRDGVLARQALDDAEAQFKARQARVNSLVKTFELVRIGPRKEQIDSMRGQVQQARGAVSFYETQLSNTVIKAPVTGTILEREVERGEFVTTSFVGERGAKGFVVSLADLNDLEVELDISQNDFNKLRMKQRAMITVDAWPSKRWEGFIDEMSPEANRQKATVQVKVKVANPDEFLRPEMNASVAFVAERTESAAPASVQAAYAPAAAIKNGKVFVVVNGKAVERAVKTGGVTAQGIRIDEGLIGGEDVVLNPPAELKDGMKVKVKGS